MKKFLLIVFSILMAVPLAAQAKYARFDNGSIGDITPSGWLREFLQRQKDGMTGHPESLSYPYDSCLWDGEEITRNTESYGSDWWRYEQTAYYTDGLLRMAYLLGDEELIQRAEGGIRYTVDHRDSSGRMAHTTFGDAEMWPVAVFFRAMKAYQEYHSDTEIAHVLAGHYRTLDIERMKQWRNVMSLEGMLWAYGLTGEKTLLDMSEEVWNAGEFSDLTPQACALDRMPVMHGVTCCEELKLPLLLYAYTGKTSYLDLALNALGNLEREHLLPDGVPVSAELLYGLGDVRNSHETCDIADFTWTLGYFLETLGDGKYGDMMEKAVFNAAPGVVTKDFRSLQYFSSVNQFIATGTSNSNEFFHGSTWMAYRPTHQTECCAGNVHRIMPNYVDRMWMKGRNGEAVAALYGPSSFKVGDVTIREETSYPFEEDIRFTFKTRKASRLCLMVRIPSWCENPEIRVNGKVQTIVNESGFARIEKKFSSRDVVTVHLPMEVKVRTMQGKGCYVERGPLLYSYAIPTRKTEDLTVYDNMNGKVPGDPSFKCWSMTPSGEWNYALSGAPEEIAAKAVVSKAPISGYPLDSTSVPVKIKVPVRKIEWELEEGRYTPDMPSEVKAVEENDEYIWLVPYGSTELRLTVFPMVDGNVGPAWDPNPAGVSCHAVDPLTKVFPEDKTFPEAPEMAFAAAGTHCEFQFAICPSEPVTDFRLFCMDLASDNGDIIDGGRCGVVGYVSVSEPAEGPAHDVLTSASGMFPDPIIEKDRYEFPAGQTICPWITVFVPSDAKPGVYRGTVVMEGKHGGKLFSYMERIQIKVYPVAMRKPDFGMTTWSYDHDECLRAWNLGNDVVRGSDDYWEYMDQLTDLLAESYQTMTRVPLLRVIDITRGSDGKWSFDFTKFGEIIQFYIDKGIAERIQGKEFGGRLTSAWVSDYGLEVPDGNGWKILPPSDKRVREFYSQFLPQLRSYLESKGWLDRYVQQVCDEPINENAASYREVMALVKSYWKDIIILDASQTTDIVGAIDIWCPQLDSWSENPAFYSERQEKGDHLWFYTCCYPVGEYPNRFIEQALIKTRMMYWMGFNYGAEGYLHWAFNFWNPNSAREASVWTGDMNLPAGDSWIIYPGERWMLRSIRYEQVRDGIEDITLLKMLEEKNPGAAKAISGTLIEDFETYCTSPAQYYEARKQVLEQLSE